MAALCLMREDCQLTGLGVKVLEDGVPGYGVYQTPPEQTEECVLDAIHVGYRSIDTAQAYGNEEGVGNALAKCGLPREEFFITTKVWITNAGYEKAKASIEESLRKLQVSYIDDRVIIGTS